MKKYKKNKIIIFDTTLRDGEQSLKRSLNLKEKLKIAKTLEKLNVDVIEVGFPISSPEEFNSIQYISKNIKNSKICGLARCVEKDITVAAKAMKYSNNFRIHVFLGTSDIHVKFKLKKEFDEIIEMAVKSVKQARKYTDDVEFSCEDAGRTNLDNLCKIVEKTINAGATTINIPDTVGYTLPYQFNTIISSLYKRVPNIDQAIVSVHCHNDLGMATANSITAIKAGARQVEGTITGIGERAGNAALEEIIMAIKIHYNTLGFYTSINYKKIYETSKIISNICQIKIPKNKAIIGSNAFSHSSGIHQDGMLKNKNSYEIINPKSIGSKKTKLSLTSRSGRSAIKFYMSKMGYSENEYKLTDLYKKFLYLADEKGRIYDYNLEELAFSKYKKKDNFLHFKGFRLYILSKKKIFLKIQIQSEGEKKIKKKSIKIKNDFIYTIYKVLKKITGIPNILYNFELHLKEKKENKLGKVKFILIKKNQSFVNQMKIDSDSIYKIFKNIIKCIFNSFNDMLKNNFLKKNIKKNN